MHDSVLLITFIGVDLLAKISPGPNFIFLTQTTLRRSGRDGAWVVLAITLTNIAWCAFAVSGLSGLFAALPWLHGTIRICGGAYLIFLGVSLWRGNSGTERGRSAPPTGNVFVRALITNLTNPKAAVYYGSVCTLLLTPGTPGWLRPAAIVIVGLNTIVWYGAVAALFSRAAVQQFYARISRWLDRVAGVALALMGTRLILAKK